MSFLPIYIFLFPFQENTKLHMTNLSFLAQYLVPDMQRVFLGMLSDPSFRITIDETFTASCSENDGNRYSISTYQGLVKIFHAAEQLAQVIGVKNDKEVNENEEKDKDNKNLSSAMTKIISLAQKVPLLLSEMQNPSDQNDSKGDILPYWVADEAQVAEFLSEKNSSNPDPGILTLSSLTNEDFATLPVTTQLYGYSLRILTREMIIYLTLLERLCKLTTTSLASSPTFLFFGKVKHLLRDHPSVWKMFTNPNVLGSFAQACIENLYFDKEGGYADQTSKLFRLTDDQKCNLKQWSALFCTTQEEVIKLNYRYCATMYLTCLFQKIIHLIDGPKVNVEEDEKEDNSDSFTKRMAAFLKICFDEKDIIEINNKNLVRKETIVPWGNVVNWFKLMLGEFAKQEWSVRREVFEWTCSDYLPLLFPLKDGWGESVSTIGDAVQKSKEEQGFSIVTWLSSVTKRLFGFQSLTSVKNCSTIISASNYDKTVVPVNLPGAFLWCRLFLQLQNSELGTTQQWADYFFCTFTTMLPEYYRLIILASNDKMHPLPDFLQMNQNALVTKWEKYRTDIVSVMNLYEKSSELFSTIKNDDVVPDNNEENEDNEANDQKSPEDGVKSYLNAVTESDLALPAAKNIIFQTMIYDGLLQFVNFNQEALCLATSQTHALDLLSQKLNEEKQKAETDIGKLKKIIDDRQEEVQLTKGRIGMLRVSLPLVDDTTRDKLTQSIAKENTQLQNAQHTVTDSESQLKTTTSSLESIETNLQATENRTKTVQSNLAQQTEFDEKNRKDWEHFDSNKKMFQVQHLQDSIRSNLDNIPDGDNKDKLKEFVDTSFTNETHLPTQAELDEIVSLLIPEAQVKKSE